MTPFHKQIARELYFGSLPRWQREPIDRLVAEGRRRGQSNARIAYVLATAHHETARFKYDHEIGKGRGRDYGALLLLIRGQHRAYYGRGHVQLTWLANYAKMSIALSLEHGREIDLVNHPDLATVPEFASLIIWEGMFRGSFTGKNLADFIGPDGRDFRRARQTVNGMDKAELIAGYAEAFIDALNLEAMEAA